MAASLHRAVAEVLREQGVEARISTAASSTLARQIEHGAPAAVFLSANKEWMDYLAERRLLLDGTRREIVRNRLVLVWRQEGASADLREATDARLALGDPEHVTAQILDLVRHLQEELGMAVLMITHDLGVIAETAHRVVVMYASKIVEMADVKELFATPRHPYTRGLFRSIPAITGGRDRLETIEGTVPNPLEFPIGCKFHNRCAYATEHCVDFEPPLKEIGPGHQAACWLLDPDGPMYDPEKLA